MDRWKAEQGRGRENRKIRRKKSKKKENADALKGGKVLKHCVFPMIWGSGGSKSRLAKAAGAEPAGQMRDEKLHAVVARSTFPSQNVQATPGSDHFWKLMSKKCTPLWREAHFQVKMCKTHQLGTIFGSWDVEKVHAVVARSTFPSQNVKNTRGFGPLLEVQMWLRFGSLHYTIHSTTLQYITLHYTPQYYNYNYTTTLHYTPLHSTRLHYTPLH